MKFQDIIKIIIEADGVPPVSASVQVPEQPAAPVAPLPKEPSKILTSGYDKAKQITIDCLTILKNCIELGLNLEGVITPELEDKIKSIEIPDAVSEENIAESITMIHDGIPEKIDNELWSEFNKICKVKNKPIGNRVWKKMLDEANLAGWSIDQVLEYCCEKGYARFEAEWLKQPNNSFGNKQAQSDTKYFSDLMVGT